MPQSFKLIILSIIVIVSLGYLLVGKQSVELNEMGYEEIKSLESINELSIYDLVRLAASRKIVDSIFATKDTSVNIFKEQIKVDYKSPMIFLSRKNEREINESEIVKLKKLIDGNNFSYQIISGLAPYCEARESTIGAEVQFILRRIDGEKIFCSSDILRFEYLNRLIYKLGLTTL